MQITKKESSSNSTAKNLLHMLKVVYYMLRKGIISKRKLMMELHLLLKRGKLAGKALGNLMTFHGNHHTEYYHSSSSAYSFSSFSCMSVDPSLSFYDPREVEFSCSNTPSYPANIPRRKNHHHRSNRNYSCDCEAVAAVAKAFEMLNNSSSNAAAADMSDSEPVLPSPSPMIAFGKSPAKMVRQLRITDSPFPITEDEVADGRVDEEAEKFIRRFYEQLRMQPATPEYRLRRGA